MRLLQRLRSTETLLVIGVGLGVEAVDGDFLAEVLVVGEGTPCETAGRLEVGGAGAGGATTTDTGCTASARAI